MLNHELKLNRMSVSGNVNKNQIVVIWILKCILKHIHLKKIIKTIKSSVKYLVGYCLKTVHA